MMLWENRQTQSSFHTPCLEESDAESDVVNDVTQYVINSRVPSLCDVINWYLLPVLDLQITCVRMRAMEHSQRISIAVNICEISIMLLSNSIRLSLSLISYPSNTSYTIKFNMNIDPPTYWLNLKISKVKSNRTQCIEHYVILIL